MSRCGGSIRRGNTSYNLGMANPPSTVITVPVEKGSPPESSEFTVLPMSSGRPQRICGTMPCSKRVSYFCCTAEVMFDAIPERTFSGEITNIFPTLVSVFDFDTLSGIVSLEDQITASGKILPSGLSSPIDLKCRSASNALYIPLEALHYSEDGEGFVYVLNAQGATEMRKVSTGLETITSVEVTSGLDEGEIVITAGVDPESSQS